MEYERLFDELLFFISLSISTMIGFEMVLNHFMKKSTITGTEDSEDANIGCEGPRLRKRIQVWRGKEMP